MPAYFERLPREQAKQVNFGLPFVDPNPERIWPPKVWKVGDHVKDDGPDGSIACVEEIFDGGGRVRVVFLNGELKGQELTCVSGLFESVSLLEVLAVVVAEADAQPKQTCVEAIAAIMESPL